MNNQTIIDKFKLICDAVNNLGYQISHIESSKLTMNCYISVYSVDGFDKKWIQFITIHLIDDKQIQFQTGKNYFIKDYFIKNMSKIFDKSVIPIDGESIIKFYTDFIKYKSLIICIDDGKSFITKTFNTIKISTETLLISKIVHSVTKDSILILPSFYDKNWLTLKKYSQNITLFKGCLGILLFIFNTSGKYKIIVESEDVVKLKSQSETTYIINVV